MYPYGFGVREGGGLEFDPTEPIQLIRMLYDYGVRILNITMGNLYFNPHVNRPYAHGGYEAPEHPLVGVARMLNGMTQLKEAVPGMKIHKSGCSPFICLSVPFPAAPKYTLENANPGPMSLCCYAKLGDRLLYGADEQATYTLLDSRETPACVSATFACALDAAAVITQQYTVSEQGVRISLRGGDAVGFMLPVFDFDGTAPTRVTQSEGSIAVEYDGCICRYRFHGTTPETYQYYYNRNGRYRIYRVASRELHITIERIA